MLSSLLKKLEPGEAKAFWPVQRVGEEEIEPCNGIVFGF